MNTKNHVVLRAIANLFLIVSLISLASGPSSVHAQQSTEADSAATLKHMGDLQTALAAKLAARTTLRESIAIAAADDLPDLQNTLSELNLEIVEIRDSFEQLAVGTVNIDLFSTEEATLDWRNEVAQIMMPIMQNMKRITEKPRKIEQLRSKISLANEQKRVTLLALASIQETKNEAKEPVTLSAIEELGQTWQERQQDIDRDISAATIQLANLQSSDGPLWIRARDGLLAFFTGRGLTLVIAGLAGAAVWFGIKLLAKVSTKRVQGEDVKSFRTRQRIVHYALKALTVLLVLIAVMVVFYVRGDILLMGVTFLIAAAAIVGLRNTIPQFIAETKLLLNLGSIREDERVMYEGLPWKVTQLNMYSVLRNPELTGIIRLPLQDMLGLVSRPAGKEPWFPASKNDYILLDDGKMLKVLSMTPEHVQLENLAGTKSMIATADFYGMSFDNLTRSESFSISSVFGIGYSHQADSVVDIPNILKSAISNELAESDLADQVVSVSVELQEAGASSLDYWLGVKLKSTAASSYFKVRRLVQQVCVTTCTKENWDIPFPQLTLHRD